jgi:hypothetical protein
MVNSRRVVGAGRVAVVRQSSTHFWSGNLQKRPLVDQEEDERIILRWISGRFLFLR